MNFEIVPAWEIPLAEQAAVFNSAFTGYLAGWHEMDTAVFARFLCAQGADLCYSRFVRSKGTLAGFGYINRTGDVSRLAGMGIVPAARRTGAGTHLLMHLLKDARARQEQAMVLEVFEQNLPALLLYRRHGFTEMSRLFGWRRPATIAAPEEQSDDFTEIAPLCAIQTPNAFDFP